MKKIIIANVTGRRILAIFFYCAITASAHEIQTDRNQACRITLGNVQYAHHDEKMSAGEAVGKVLSGVLTGTGRTLQSTGRLSRPACRRRMDAQPQPHQRHDAPAGRLVPPLRRQADGQTLSGS